MIPFLRVRSAGLKEFEKLFGAIIMADARMVFLVNCRLFIG
jgi:hypothetical protein